VKTRLLGEGKSTVPKSDSEYFYVGPTHVTHTTCGAQGGVPVDSIPTRKLNKDSHFAGRLGATIKGSHHLERSLRIVWVCDKPIDEPNNCVECQGECGKLHCFNSGPKSK